MRGWDHIVDEGQWQAVVEQAAEDLEGAGSCSSGSVPNVTSTRS
jgi:hypothetical protein